MFIQNPEVDNPSLRDSLYKGDIFLFPPNEASLGLCSIVRGMLQEAFPKEDVQLSEFYHSHSVCYGRIFPVKKQFSESKEVWQQLSKILVSIGFEPIDNWFDKPRMRVIPTNGHKIPAARLVYSIHRDTWYSNPQTQINWWVPIFDVDQYSTFGIYPDYWTKPIQNLSKEFDYSNWKGGGGFQTYSFKHNSEKIYPILQESLDTSNELRVACKAGSILLFSSAHLHGTLANTSDRTRISVDFRTFHLNDWKAGKAAPNLDNDSKGSIMEDYLNCETLEPQILR